jgi:hypothetical protein
MLTTPVFASRDGATLVNTMGGKCDDVLRRGFLSRPRIRTDGDDTRRLTWIEGDTSGESISSVKDRGAEFRVSSYRCRKCGFIELYAIEPQGSFSF